ncbi:MAG: PEP/pyruvate-binding domain-containing protein [Myxococcota bacterium]|nr:PEP/pyruvate-binding domain-containing protein [Myxococcota bacterium]
MKIAEQVQQERAVLQELPTSKRWIIALKDAANEPGLRSSCGGKAYNLGRLAAAGFPVPDGFVLSSEAFDAAMVHFFAQAESLVEAPRRILEGPMLPALEASIRAALADLGEEAVAVRSSASDEDGAQRSFAGQQASLLNVRGADAVLQAIREVWASLMSEASLLYRSRDRLDDAPPSMAVLVQCFVPASSAGVLFTRDPIEPSSNEACICASFGLGESVVSGGDTDTFYVHRSRRQVRREVKRKASMTVCAAQQGVETRELVGERQHAASLEDWQLQRVLELGLEVERFFGEPLDIEFAFEEQASEEQALRLLQARPITGGGGERSSTGHRAAVYSNANVGEALPGVGTPLTWSIIRGFSRKGFLSAFGALGLEVPEAYEIVASFRGRVFLNLSEFMEIASQIPVLTPPMLGRLAGVPFVAGLDKTYTPRGSGAFLKRLPATLARLSSSQLLMPYTAKRWAKRFAQARDGFFGRDLGGLNDLELLSELESLDALFLRTGEVMLACASNFLVSYAATSESLKFLGGPEAVSKEPRLFAGLTKVRSAAPGLELLELARFARERGSVRRLFGGVGELGDAAWARQVLERLRESGDGRDFLERLDAFLRRWGQRALREAELATPRWAENPAFLLAVIQRHVLAPELPSASTIEAEQRALRAEAEQLIRKHFFTGVGAAFRLLLSWTQGNARRREELRAYVVDSLSMYRRFLLEVGRRACIHGLLAERDDVFFLSLDELRSWLRDLAYRPSSLGDAPGFAFARDARRHVAYRRALFDAFSRAPDPPDTFTLVHDKVLDEQTPLPADCTTLKGLPGAAGVATGPARVLLELPPGPIPIKPGEILVTGFTDVGWTPLFLVAAAVVTDRGGPLSHSCVVAREYGIPAVAGATGATQRIRTGDIIRVDGIAGLVHLMAPQTAEQGHRK